MHEEDLELGAGSVTDLARLPMQTRPRDDEVSESPEFAEHGGRRKREDVRILIETSIRGIEFPHARRPHDFEINLQGNVPGFDTARDPDALRQLGVGGQNPGQDPVQGALRRAIDLGTRESFSPRHLHVTYPCKMDHPAQVTKSTPISTSTPPPTAASAFESLLNVVHRLRAPDGCPWDRKQTFQSLRPYLIEEAYETVEVLDQVESAETLRTKPKTRDHLVEELGDVLLQILLHAEIGSETAAFDIVDVVRGLEEKLIRRHPHVFAGGTAEDAAAVVAQWEKIKRAEKGLGAPGDGLEHLLDSVGKGMPPIPRTLKVIDKVSKVGFQWGEVGGALDKMEEEVREFRAEIEAKDAAGIADELGDVLFSACNVAYLTKTDPEASLRACLRKFEGRFRFIETGLHARGKKLTDSNLSEMDELWNAAKVVERGGNPKAPVLK